MLGAMTAIALRVAGRFLSSIPALCGVLILTFLLMRVLPGDPAVFFASGPNAGQAEIEMLRRQMGLDQPIPIQLVKYVRDVGAGNLGRSLTTGQSVVTDLKQRLPASFELTVVALGMALLVSIPLGIFAAIKPNSILDHGVRAVCTLGVCVPTFVSGLVLVFVFYYLLGIAPDPTGRLDVFISPPPAVTGFLLIDFLITGDFDGWRSAAAQIVLPASTMALFVLAPLTRITRASMIGVLSSDFIRTARAVGLSSYRIYVVYALRNALLPVLTVIGIIFSVMLGANVLVEKVFSWPGVGSYALDALLSADYAPVQGFVLMMASIFVAINLLIDLLYGIADPRVSIT